VRPQLEGVDISLAGGWIEVATHRPPSRRGRDQYAPGQRIRQRSRQRDRAAGSRSARPVAAGHPGGDGAAVPARVTSAPDRGTAGLPPRHGAPLDRPVQPRGPCRAGRPAPVRAAGAGRTPADRADRRAAGPPRPVDPAPDPAVPGLAAGQPADAVPAGPAGGDLAAAQADRPRRPGP
jgi:hypothetical protein